MTASFYRLLLNKQKNADIALFGFADADSWASETVYTVSPDFYPTALFPDTKTVIVIGVPVLLPIIDTAPSVFYSEQYHVLNAHLDAEALKFSGFLNKSGMPAIPIPRDGYAGLAALQKDPKSAFSHKHAAYHAGLGVFGRNNILLTPEYGPRIRWTSVLTAALPEELGIPKENAKKIGGMKKKKLCTDCMVCVRFCPAEAVPDNKKETYPAVRIDKMKCVGCNAALGTKGTAPCGACIKVCPIGGDRNHFHRKNLQIYNEKPKNNDDEALIQSWAHIRRCGTK